MQQITIIENRPLSVKEYRGQRVVTFKDIDDLHQRPEGTAKKRFNDNRRHFIEGVDFFTARKGDFLKSEIRTLEIPNRGLIVFTETGYLMLVKSFTDDLAWAVQRALVNSYFKGKVNPPPAEYLEACGVIQQLPEAPTDEDIARHFLQALQAALSSGRYYLLPKGKHSRLERPGRLLGHYDDAVITLICSEAYSIYADAPASYTLSRSVAQTLRPALARCGLALPRTKKDGKRRIHGRECSTIRLDRGLADAMSGFKPALASRKRAALKS